MATLIKRVRWINYQERDDIREVMGQGTATLKAVIGSPITGWGEDTHTVLTLTGRVAHAKLTGEEVASLPHFDSLEAVRKAGFDPELD